jgi:hypothetical protein
MVFKTTPSKDLVRDKYDKQIVTEFHEAAGCKLSYFGLPGALMLDVLSWKESLRFFTAVERDDYLIRHRLLGTAFEKGIDPQLQLLSGDIDDVMANWKDVNGEVPALRSYDIVNLDYEGGIVYKDLQGDSRRMRSIKKFIMRQADEKQDFLMLMTVNTRNKDCKEFENTLDDIEAQLSEYGIDASEIIEWYKAQGYDLKLKVYVPYVFDSIAASHRFMVRYHPPVSYLGSSNRRMVHFVMQMEYDETRAGRPRTRSLVYVMNIPLLEIRKNTLTSVPIKTIALTG